MSFARYETSRDSGQPINLILFRFGSAANDLFAFTDHEKPFPFGGLTYEPVTLDIGELTSSGTLDKAALSVMLPQDNPLVDLFRLRPPSSVVTVIIRQGHANDEDAQFIVGWSGRVVGFDVDGESDIAELTCEPISTSLQQTMLRRHWQYGCPHALYGPGCRASKARATVLRSPTAVSGAVLTFGADWATADRKAKYHGGMAIWGEAEGRRQVRRILRCEPDGRVQLANAADGLVPGMVVSLILGCNHKTGIPSLKDDGDCGPLHDNILNFGGDPWIPLENPVGIKNNYY